MSDDTQPKLTITSEEMGQVLAQEYILSEAYNYQPGLEVDEVMKPYFLAKTMLYRLAIVLMVIMTEEEENPPLLSVRISIEQVFFVPNVDGEDFLVEVRNAMKKLSDLLFSQERREFTWGISWFEEIGIDETDPINLSLFATNWMRQYTFVTKTLRNCIIVAPEVFSP